MKLSDKGVSAQQVPYYLVSQGTHRATCFAILDAGKQEASWNGLKKEHHQIFVGFEISGETITIDGEARPATFFKKCNLSVHESSALQALAISLLGRRLTPEDDLTCFIGANCCITIAHKISQTTGNTYAYIANVSMDLQGYEKLVPSQKLILDLDSPQTWNVIPLLPSWVRAEINNSLTLASRGIRIDDNGAAVPVSGMTAVLPPTPTMHPGIGAPVVPAQPAGIAPAEIPPANNVPISAPAIGSIPAGVPPVSGIPVNMPNNAPNTNAMQANHQPFNPLPINDVKPDSIFD